MKCFGVKCAFTPLSNTMEVFNSMPPNYNSFMFKENSNSNNNSINNNLRGIIK